MLVYLYVHVCTQNLHMLEIWLRHVSSNMRDTNNTFLRNARFCIEYFNEELYQTVDKIIINFQNGPLLVI